MMPILMRLEAGLLLVLVATLCFMLLSLAVGHPIS
jgi:hypothetical protein